MENASKALLMAAGVLIALVIVGAFMLMMSSLTDYQEKSYQSKADAQTTEFNNQYTGYIRDDIRGSDMFSLMNKVLDYNNRKNDDGYTEMLIDIDMKGHAKDLLYDKERGNQLVNRNVYDQKTIGEIRNGVEEIEKTYQQKYASQLVTEISNIESLLTDKDGEQKFVDQKILPINDKKELSSVYHKTLPEIYEDALVYYEYVQFKRAVFDCIDSEYDANTGRIISMNFECTGMGV